MRTNLPSAMLALAILLTGCGGVEAEDDPSFNGELATCVTRAVRSNTINTTEHSTNGGVTWLPGACR